MRILLMSDLRWHDLFSDHPVDYLKIYTSRIYQIEPDIVIFAGDSIYDMGHVNRSQYKKFLDLLNYLDQNGIKSFVIQGNHDDDDGTYTKLKKEIQGLSNIDEISGKCIIYKNLRIVGIPYGAEKNAVSQLGEENFDIVIAHPDFSNRTALFELNTEFLFCGHFDTLIGQVFKIIFISTNGNHAVINYENEKKVITYYERKPRFVEPESRKAELINDKFVWIKGKQDNIEKKYIEQVKLLFEAKKQIENLNKKEQIALINNLLSKGITKRQIEYYIGKKRLLYNYSNLPRKRSKEQIFTFEE
jgi:hypothetical protein